MSDENPKIIVDDDWKSQVEEEKQKLQEQVENQSNDKSQNDDPQFPEATMTTLVTMLAMQAGSAMGQFPDPTTGKPQINKSLAKHFIDSLAVLEEKTKGNLDKEEAELLTSTVHQFRIAFIGLPDSVPDEQGAGDQSSSGPDSQKSSTIELP